MHTAIAIDGPAASGKSSVARELARKLGFVYVNTGAMYRAVTWWVLKQGIAPGDTAQVLTALKTMDFQAQLDGAESSIRIDGIDPAPYLCDDEVNRSVSTVSGIREVRSLLVARQRAFLEQHDLVMEGRDIGSVVFPYTPYKFYIDASPEVRARRRALQGQNDEVSARDKQDSSRQASPLTIPGDAQVIDSSDLTVDGVVDEVLKRLKSKGLSFRS